MKLIPLRQYQLSDIKLLVCAQKFLLHAKAQEQRFIAFSPSIFTAQFFAQFQHKTDECAELKEDESYRYVISHAKSAVDDHLAIVLNQFEELCFFLEMALADSTTTLELLGIKDRYKASRKRISRLTFFRRMAQIFSSHEELFRESGFDCNKIALFVQSCEKLYQLEEQLDSAKGERSRAAYERIKKLNDLWKTIQIIAKASRFVYASYPDEINPFVIPAVKRKKRVSLEDSPASESSETQKIG